MKSPKKPQSVSIAPGAVAAPEAIGQLLQYREDSLTAQLAGCMARAMKGAGPSGKYACNWVLHSHSCHQPTCSTWSTWGTEGGVSPLASNSQCAMFIPECNSSEPVASRKSNCVVSHPAAVSCSQSTQSAFAW